MPKIKFNETVRSLTNSQVAPLPSENKNRVFGDPHNFSDRVPYAPNAIFGHTRKANLWITSENQLKTMADPLNRRPPYRRNLKHATANAEALHNEVSQYPEPTLEEATNQAKVIILEDPKYVDYEITGINKNPNGSWSATLCNNALSICTTIIVISSLATGAILYKGGKNKTKRKLKKH